MNVSVLYVQSCNRTLGTLFGVQVAKSIDFGRFRPLPADSARSSATLNENLENKITLMWKLNFRYLFMALEQCFQAGHSSTECRELFDHRRPLNWRVATQDIPRKRSFAAVWSGPPDSGRNALPATANAEFSESLSIVSLQTKRLFVSAKCVCLAQRPCLH